MARASLTSSRDFRRVYRSGKKSRVDGITVWAAPSHPGTPARLGMAVRATTGTAVERNRLRRRVREIFRTYDPSGYDVVVAATKDAAGKNFQELSEVLSTALGRAGAGAAR